MIQPDRAARFLAELDAALAGAADPPTVAMQLIAKSFSHYQWVGIYWLAGHTLTLGPFVGKPTEHTQIAVGQGVCGTAIAQGKNQLIADVREVANYLACSTTTRAEIVVLIHHASEVIGQIDADSDAVGAFDASDEALLNAVAARLGR
ncbi:MAG TPA: GAF domain-containing protein [Pirellulales bacterium]|jgi:GAF domain-containing protein